VVLPIFFRLQMQRRCRCLSFIVHRLLLLTLQLLSFIQPQLLFFRSRNLLKRCDCHLPLLSSEIAIILHQRLNVELSKKI
jgi:hypothetical protein